MSPGSPVYPVLLFAESRLEIPNVLLGLFEQRTKGFTHIGETEVAGFSEPFPVALELLPLESQVGGQRFL